MPRAPRECVAGGFYHVIARGNAGECIVADDVDRQYFLQRLAVTVEQFTWRCHAYCLMDTHYHLALETPLPNLSPGMARLNSRYAQSFNARHDRSGHVFGSRYRSIVIEKEDHFYELCRYIVLNPVRAGLCADPASWPWSSYLATAGLKAPEPFLSTDRLLADLGSQQGYRNMVAEAMSRV